jgi:hypothetical protein
MIYHLNDACSICIQDCWLSEQFMSISLLLLLPSLLAAIVTSTSNTHH